MTEIILNEKEWVEAALERRDLGKRPIETINRYARYLFSKGYKTSEIERALEEFLLRCDPNVSLAKWQDAIRNAAKKAGKYRLINIEGIPITKAEMEAVQSVSSKMERKLLFALIALAKYKNVVNSANSGWVNIKSSEIFALANISSTSKRQALMLNDLWQGGYIGYSKVVDNTNINVKVINDDSPQELFLTDYRNLGNQYMLYCGEKYFVCRECGIVERMASNGQMFCKQCAVVINRRKTLQHYHDTVA